MSDVLRLLVALAVVGLLGRAVRPAWRNRGLATTVWRRIRPRHVVGCLALLTVVLATAVGLMAAVPATAYGLGTFIGLSGNAVFAPLDEVAARTGSSAAPGGDGGVLLLVAGFLGVLLALFPWLAYVEERVFREGLEDAGPARELWTALRFGLVHLVMLIPVAAAVAVGVAGFAYGRVYRAAYARVRRRQAATSAYGLRLSAVEEQQQARDEAVLAATVWHTTFNSLIVLLVLAGLAVASL